MTTREDAHDVILSWRPPPSPHFATAPAPSWLSCETRLLMAKTPGNQPPGKPEVKTVSLFLGSLPRQEKGLNCEIVPKNPFRVGKIGGRRKFIFCVGSPQAECMTHWVAVAVSVCSVYALARDVQREGSVFFIHALTAEVIGRREFQTTRVSVNHADARSNASSGIR